MRKRSALHPLSHPPEGAPGNLPEILDGLVSPLLREAAVLVPLILRDSGVQVLFTVRNRDLAHHGGQVAFPGGRLEPGESIITAALREVHEEIGVESRFVEPVGFLDPIATISGFRVTPTVGWIAPHAPLLADPGEVSEIFEVPLSVLRDPGRRSERILTWRGRERRTSAYAHGHHDIWGVTAWIVDQLVALPEPALQRRDQ